MIDIEAIKARAEAATPAPWIIDVDEQTVRATKISGKKILFDKSAAVWSEDNNSNDANFIANAREDIPALIAEVERLEGEKAEARKLVKEIIALDAKHYNTILEIETAGKNTISQNRHLKSEVERLQSELDRVTAERDAAVEDIGKMHTCGQNCILCKKFYACEKRLYEVGNCDDFEYRGKGASKNV